MYIGIVSDSHGLLRDEVIENLNGCEVIIHAGDIVKISNIETLKEMGDLYCVRGNCDRDKSFDDVDKIKIVKIKGLNIGIIHDISEVSESMLNLCNIIVYGHSHKYKVYENNGIIYINPGSIGPKRFNLPTTMIKMHIKDNNELKGLNKINDYKYEFLNCEIEIIQI